MGFLVLVLGVCDEKNNRLFKKANFMFAIIGLSDLFQFQMSWKSITELFFSENNRLAVRLFLVVFRFVSLCKVLKLSTRLAGGNGTWQEIVELGRALRPASPGKSQFVCFELMVFRCKRRNEISSLGAGLDYVFVALLPKSLAGDVVNVEFAVAFDVDLGNLSKVKIRVMSNAFTTRFTACTLDGQIDCPCTYLNACSSNSLRCE